MKKQDALLLKILKRIEQELPRQSAEDAEYDMRDTLSAMIHGLEQEMKR